MDDDANGYRRGWFLRIPSYDASFRTFAMRRGARTPAGDTMRPRMRANYRSVEARRGVFSDRCARRSRALEFSATGSGRTHRPGRRVQGARHGVHVHSSHQCANRRSDRPSKRRAHPDAEPVAGADVRNGGGGHLSRRGVPLARARRAADSVDRQQSHLRSAERMGKRPAPSPSSLRRSREAFRAAHGTSKRTTSPPQRFRRRTIRPARCSSRFVWRAATAPGGTRRWASAWAKRSPSARTWRFARTHRAPCACRFRRGIPQSGERWQRSIYLDAEPRDVIVRFAEMTPVGSSGAFDPALADTLLFVVDTTNTLPGTAGSFTLENLRVER